MDISFAEVGASSAIEVKTLDSSLVRRSLAYQLRDKYSLRNNDPMADILEANIASRGMLVAAFYHGNEGERLARVLTGEIRDQTIRRLCSREVVKPLQMNLMDLILLINYR